MKRFSLLFILISQMVNAQVQEVCDELGFIPDVGSFTEIGPLVGDTVSIDAFGFTLIIEANSQGSNSDTNFHLFWADSNSIHGDNRMRVIPPTNTTSFYIESRASSTPNLFPGLKINGVNLINNPYNFGGLSYDYNDFPFVVGDVTVSLDTILTYPYGGTAIYMADCFFRMNFEGITNDTEIIIRNSFDIHLEKICAMGEALNIKEGNDYDVHVFENNMLNVNLKNNVGKLNLYNTQGQFIQSVTIDKERVINLNNLDQGVYFVQLMFNNEVYSEKIFIK
ncbi:MAG: T9SS type A sorting domain-containing protein [Flavobacteriales bacterium]